MSRSRRVLFDATEATGERAAARGRADAVGRTLGRGALAGALLAATQVVVAAPAEAAGSRSVIQAFREYEAQTTLDIDPGRTSSLVRACGSTPTVRSGSTPWS